MDVRGWANGFSAGLRATCWHKVQCVACYPIESSSSPASLEKVLPIYRYWTPYRCTERSRFDGLVVTSAECASSVPPFRGKLTSLIAFVVICGDVLLDQWVWGAPNAWFVFGTMCLIAAACITLFAFIALIGLVTSLAFHDGLLGQSQTNQPTARDDAYFL